MSPFSSAPTLLPVFAACTALAIAGCSDAPMHSRAAAITCPPNMVRAARQAICIDNACGNGVVDPGEVCDDGNRIAGDGCSPDCQSTEVCGNGIVDYEMGEVCDSGLLAQGGCSSDCRPHVDMARRYGQPAGQQGAALADAETLTCTPEQLREALAQAAEAQRKARRQGWAAAQHARQLAEMQQSAGDTSRTIAELRQSNEELERMLAAERARIAALEQRLPSGRAVALQ